MEPEGWYPFGQQLDLVYFTVNRGFHKWTNNGNNDNIAICVFLYICSFLLYSNHILLVNTKLYITGYKRIIFQGWIFWRSSKFQMAQLKHKWQYCHFCIVESLWKPRLDRETEWFLQWKNCTENLERPLTFRARSHCAFFLWLWLRFLLSWQMGCTWLNGSVHNVILWQQHQLLSDLLQAKTNRSREQKNSYSMNKPLEPRLHCAICDCDFFFAHNGLHRSWWCCCSRIVWTLPLSPAQPIRRIAVAIRKQITQCEWVFIQCRIMRGQMRWRREPQERNLLLWYCLLDRLWNKHVLCRCADRLSKATSTWAYTCIK